MPLRVLVVDDTAIYRKIVSEILLSVPGVQVVGTAIDGKLAIEKIKELKPDLVTLDLEMPGLDGVEVLRALRGAKCKVGVIMLSAFTSQGAAATTEALHLGAFDFVLKPESHSPLSSVQLLKQRLSDRVAAFAHSRGLSLEAAVLPVTQPAAAPAITARASAVALEGPPPQVVVLGVSTGGPEALTQVVPHLPQDLAAPLFIVQHMPPLFTKSLAQDLDRRSLIHVREATDGDLALPGQCFIAPGGRQMKIERTERGPMVRITDDPPENSCRPAVDYLFRSAAHQYGARVLALVMTGMGSDGALGCRLLKRKGARVLAQDKETSVVFGMPGVVIAQDLADEILPLSEIAPRLGALVGVGAPA